MSVEVNNETDAVVDEAEFAACGRFVLDQLRVHPQAELSILFVDEDTMTQLHERWLQEPGPTDVMSFPMDEIRPALDDEEPQEGMLGDVVVCPTVAARQARAAGHSAQEEMLLLTVHGILHLLGYDHAEEAEKREMFDLQRRLLLTFLAAKDTR